MASAVALLVSGTSGMALPRKLLSWLARHPEVERIHLVVLRGAAQVLAHARAELHSCLKPQWKPPHS